MTDRPDPQRHPHPRRRRDPHPPVRQLGGRHTGAPQGVLRDGWVSSSPTTSSSSPTAPRSSQYDCNGKHATAACRPLRRRTNPDKPTEIITNDFGDVRFLKTASVHASRRARGRRHPDPADRGQSRCASPASTPAQASVPATTVPTGYDGSRPTRRSPGEHYAARRRRHRPRARHRPRDHRRRRADRAPMKAVVLVGGFGTPPAPAHLDHAQADAAGRQPAR